MEDMTTKQGRAGLSQRQQAAGDLPGEPDDLLRCPNCGSGNVEADRENERAWCVACAWDVPIDEAKLNPGALGFIDMERMKFSETVKPRHAGEFVIRPTADDAPAEIMVALYDLEQGRGLTPRLQVFGDGVESLRAFIHAGGLATLEEVSGTAEFAGRLTALGLTDRSEIPLKGTTC